MEDETSGTAGRQARFEHFLAGQGWIGRGILARDWSASSLGAIGAWPPALQTTLRFVLTTRQPIVFFWGPDLLQFFNEPYSPILEGMPPDPIGAPFKVFWGEVFEGVRPYFERAMAGEGTWEQDLPLTLTRNGVTEQTYWSFSYSPLFDDEGRISGFMNVVNETTVGVTDRQKLERANASLAEQYEKTRVIADGARDYAVITIAPDRRITSWSTGAAGVFGQSAEEMIGRLADELFTPADREAGIPAQELRTAAAEGVASDVRWHQRPDGGRVFMDGTVRALDGDGGGFIKIARNATAEKLAADRQAALLELGDRLRGATAVMEVVGIAGEVLGRTLDASRAGYALIDLRAGTFRVMQDWTLAGIDSLVGEYPLSMFPATLARAAEGEALIVPDIADAAWLAADRGGYAAIGTRSQIKFPLLARGELEGVLFVHHATPRDWTREEVDFAHGVADRTYAALGKIKAESEQEVLNNELSHRLKNMMTLVQAIADQTLRDVPDRAPVRAFTERLHALSSAHDVLLRQNWTAAPMMSVVTAVLVAFGPFDRFDVEGPEVKLGPRTTLSLSMLLHELATNALKYGSLSNETGRVSLAWGLEEDGEPTFVLRWRETGGPGAQEPARRGFGSRLIRSGLVGTGGVELRYLTSGFEADMSASLAHVQAS